MKALVLSVLVVLAQAAFGQISFSSEVITQGVPVTVSVEEPAEYLYVTYRPSSAVSLTDSVKSETTDGYSFAWIPARAGVVSLVAGVSTENVSVRYDGVSMPGILVMIFAALILFGGAGFSLKALLG